MVLLFEGIMEDEVMFLCEELNKEMAGKQYDFYNKARVTFSGGLSACRMGMRTTEWYSLVDEALYSAKREGKNRIRWSVVT